MRNPLIAFDESGNTGQDLLNPDQPTFSLASVNLSDDDARTILDTASSSKLPELKFGKLRRTSVGQQAVVAMLQSEALSENTAKLSVVDKSFMVTSKIVDMLVETLAHRDGIDLYEQGANLGMANMFEACMPAFLGKDNFSQLQRKFVRMIREKSVASVRDFYVFSWKLYDICCHEEGKDCLAFILASKDCIGDVLRHADVVALDPAVPTFVLQCDEWGKTLDCDFDLVHDESKPIRNQERVISYCMAKDEPTVEIGYDRRKFTLPLRATGINFANSKDVPQLQIADVLAGAASYWACHFVHAPVEEGFWKALDSCNLQRLVVNTIWPTTAVTPEALGTTETGGINAVKYVAELIKRQRKDKE